MNNWSWQTCLPIGKIENKEYLKKTIERCKKQKIILPKFSEIKNPGVPFGGLTITDITSRNISKRRNEVIADVFNRAHFGERKGRGISLILNKEPKTKFELIADLFITTFKRKTNLIPQISEGISEGLKSLLEYITNNPGTNAINISDKLDKPLKTIERWIKILKKENKLEYRGSRKLGGYFKK
jgi:ATP-dependent DNA helicase RecG